MFIGVVGACQRVLDAVSLRLQFCTYIAGANMASKTKRTELIRKRKKTAKGKKRKAAARTKGTTRSKKELFGE